MGKTLWYAIGGHKISQAHLLFNSILCYSINLDGTYIITAYQRLINWFAIIDRLLNTNKYRPFRYLIIKFTWILIDVLLYLIVFFQLFPFQIRTLRKRKMIETHLYQPLQELWEWSEYSEFTLVQFG